MTTGKEVLHAIGRFIAFVTDWFLIVAGILLILVAICRIDVAMARYAVTACGLFLFGTGCWYRHRNVQRYR